MSTRIPPGPEPGPSARPDDPDPEGVRPVEDGGDPAPAAAADDGQPWTAMWRDALEAAFRTSSVDDDGPAPGNA